MFDDNKGVCGSPLTGSFDVGRPGNGGTRVYIDGRSGPLCSGTNPPMACAHADSRAGPDASPAAGRAFWQRRGRLSASLTELEATGLLAVSAQAIGTGKAMELAQEEIARAASGKVQLVSLDDPAYPPRLKEIYDPPVILYVRGATDVLAQPGIAVVGTRHPTPYGSGMAERLAIDLAARGLIIQSGMARGVDTAAHRGAISGKGKTVAVFGTGVDVPYPKENTRLSERIVAMGGALISEFPLGTFAAPQNFPIRNRIISGMSMGVLVVEAAEYSGTRITARCAPSRTARSSLFLATSPTRIPGDPTL